MVCAQSSQSLRVAACVLRKASFPLSHPLDISLHAPGFLVLSRDLGGASTPPPAPVACMQVVLRGAGTGGHRPPLTWGQSKSVNFGYFFAATKELANQTQHLRL